jgi:hypothetical protein
MVNVSKGELYVPMEIFVGMLYVPMVLVHFFSPYNHAPARYRSFEKRDFCRQWVEV